MMVRTCVIACALNTDFCVKSYGQLLKWQASPIVILARLQCFISSGTNVSVTAAGVWYWGPSPCSYI